MIQATAPAKIILLGEHAVVHNQPAIAIPVSQLRATASIASSNKGNGLQIVASDLGITFPVTLDGNPQDNPILFLVRLVLERLGATLPDLVLSVRSDIPLASGLGSGAAISTVVARALSTALGYPFQDADLNELVYEVEKLHHGTPSGIDNTVIVYERPVYFVRGHPIEFLSVKGLFHFLIADTGVSALTRIAVADVKQLYQENPAYIGSNFAAIGELVDKGRVALESGNAGELGSLMNQNHLYLQNLTVSSPELDRLVQAALDADAFGAKLSGGGRGGNMIALVPEDLISIVQNALYDAGAVRVFHTILR